MIEEKDKKLSGGEMHSPFLAWVENFWYHYKWPFLGILLTAIVLIVCLAQCTRNGKGDDAVFMYAGGYTMTVEERRNMESVLKPFAEDINGDDRVVLGMMNFAIYTKDEIAKYDKNDQAHVAQLSYDNREAFDQEILAGSATLCFLSPSLFADVAKAGGLHTVADYADALPSGAEAAMYGDVAYGVKLSSLPLYTYPGFSSLPEDTVVCLRTNTSMNALFGGDTAKLLYEANLAMAKRALGAAVYAPQ